MQSEPVCETDGHSGRMIYKDLHKELWRHTVDNIAGNFRDFIPVPEVNLRTVGRELVAESVSSTWRSKAISLVFTIQVQHPS